MSDSEGARRGPTSGPTELEILHGRDVPLACPRELRAGAIRAQYLDGDLRYVGSASQEYVRRIYVAVRDQAWDTISPTRSDEVIQDSGDGFWARFDARSRSGELDFRWRCEIEGRSDGTVTYSIDGEAQSDFPYMRIGICLLHPVEGMAGRPFTALTPDGPVEGRLPRLIGVQEFDGQGFAPLFPAFSSLSISLADGPELTLRFEGDLFETEDQRNWTDASFKSYSHNPPTRAEPWAIAAGTRLRHSVTIVPPPEPASAPRRSITDGARIRLGATSTVGPPRLGTAIGPGPTPSEREAELLEAAGFRHLRVDVAATDSQAPEALARALELCDRLGCRLEVALYCDPQDPENGLPELAAAIAAAAIERVIVLDERAEATPEVAVEAARRHLPPGPALGAGTNVFFAELNRRPPRTAAIDFVAYPVTPQVHADDDLSLLEAPSAQADTVRTAGERCAGLPVVVSPLTLKPRFNPDTPAESAGEEPAPDTVDPRQMSLVGAAWTLASVASLAGARAHAATYFEALGPRGILERERPDPVPGAQFPTMPGAAFPLYHVLADLGELRDGVLVDCASSEPLRVQAIALASGGQVAVLAANLTPHSASARLEGLEHERWRVRRLDATSAMRAAREPAAHRRDWDQIRARGGELQLELAPYAFVRLESAPGT